MVGPPEMLAVIGATIIDGNGGTPIKDGVILIEGRRIVAAGDRSTEIPACARPIDATGKFVIPGLMAPHQFLVDGVVPATTILYEGRYDEVILEAAQLALRGGITTVFDSWGPRDALIKARDSVNEGQVSAARIYLCGNWVGLGGPYSDDMRPQFKEAVGDTFAARVNSLWEANIGQQLTRMSPEEVRREVRRYLRTGVDFLSYVVNVHRHGAFQHIVFSPRVQQVIVEEAHQAGLPVQGIFITTGEGLHLAVGAGADIMLLCPWAGSLPAEAVALIAQRELPCVIFPISTNGLEWYRQHPHTCDRTLFEFHETSERDVRALIGAGAVLLPAIFGAVLHADFMSTVKDKVPPEDLEQLGERHIHGLKALQEKGMKPMAALMAATRNVAQAFKVDKDLGTLERDKLADLVVLDRNPLENAENYRSISLVMKEGEVVDRAALPTQRLLTAEPSNRNDAERQSQDRTGGRTRSACTGMEPP